MTAALLFGVPDAKLVESAYNIAWNYLLQTGQIASESRAHLRLSEEIVRLLEKGERHPLRIANKAIAAYERDIEARTLDAAPFAT
jgi:hypothetical protein